MQREMIRNIDDVKALESVPLEERVPTKSTYELLKQGASVNWKGRKRWPGRNRKS